MVALTAEQRAVLESRASRVFVSAAAGSGKTTLLVERYLRAVLDDGIPMEHLPTVTFTRKAAAEMRKRIRQGLLQRGRPDLAWGLDEAPIGTIHSLCSRLLRARVIEAGVDPGFRVLDEEQTKILSHEAMKHAWDSVVRDAVDAELELLARHGERLRVDVPLVHAYLRQTGMTEPRLDPAQPGDLRRERAALSAAIDRAAELLAGMELTGRAGANRDGMIRCREWLVEAQPTWDAIQSCYDFVPHMGCAANAKPAFDLFKQALLGFRSALGRHYLMGVHTLADRMLERYHRAFREAKRSKGVLDFSDLEVEALALLRRDDAPFEGRAWLMVDEFQDTNSLQLAILDGLGAGGTLTVGDPFQSIYSFRGADVGVFLDRHAQVGEAQIGDAPFDARAGGDSLVASLTTNFRSSPEILTVINHIFGHESHFGDGFPALASFDEPETVAGLRSERAAVRVVVVDPDTPLSEEDCGSPSLKISRFETEAAAVAHQVGELLREGWRKRDIAILLRAFTHVSELERALTTCGIETYVVQGRGFFRSEELADVTALLRILVNPHDDPALVAVLRSPLMGLPDDVAFLLRGEAEAAGFRFLWEVLRARRFESIPPAYRAHMDLLGARLGPLRERLGSPGLASFIEAAVEAFDYDLVVLRASQGRRRLANLRKLMRLADEFESVEGPDLAAFLDYVQRRGDVSGDRESNAPTLSEEEDVVRIMTVHKAKGLEFPVVIVPGMGSVVASSDKSCLRVSKEGFSVRVRAKNGDDLTLGSYEHIRQAADRLALEEERRLYYVACTRAESHLVLVGLGTSGCTPADGAPIEGVLQALGVTDVDVSCPVESMNESGLSVSVQGVRAPAIVRSPTTDGPSRVVRCEAPSFPIVEMGRAGVRRVSFSSLERYERCPRSYYLERILGFEPDMFGGVEPAGRRSSGAASDEGGDAAARIVGTIVHLALEESDVRMRPEPETVRRLVARVLDREGVGLDAQHFERAASLVQAFWESDVVRRAMSGVRTTERPFLFEHEGVVVSGYMDLLIEDGSEWTVVDYKTTRLGGRDPLDAGAQYRFQGRLYALACLLAGAEKVSVVFLFLEAPDRPIVDVYRTEDIPGLRDALSLRLRGPLSGDFSRRPAECGGCGLEALCRAHPESTGALVDRVDGMV
ncbi:MAG: UvrD-helicase domain-containing protein [Thermoleophilia bacterium]